MTKTEDIIREVKYALHIHEWVTSSLRIIYCKHCKQAKIDQDLTEPSKAYRRWKRTQFRARK